MGQAGAVYSPFAEIVPTEASPPCTPDTYQLTLILAAPLTTATNDCVWPPDTPVAVGEMDTPSGPDGFPSIEPVPLVGTGAGVTTAAADASEP